MSSFLNFSFGGSNSDVKEPKDALMDLIQGPDGAQWQDMRTGWNSESEDICSWPGIECNENGDVTKINLENSGLIASIPSSLGSSLLSLTHLNLSSNHIFGEIPSSLTKLPNLVYINLERNKLRGNVPIFTSPKLEVVNVSHNSFSGKIPDDFGDKMIQANNLKVLDMKYNRLRGSLPTSIGKLSPTLVEFDLSSNRLYGVIPDVFHTFNQLEGLFLSNNRLSGPIPPSLTHGSNMVLSQIFIQGNVLSGTLPVALADLQHLKNLFIDGNKFTGTVPVELCSKNLNSVFFQGTPVEIRGGDADFDDDYKPVSDDETYDEDVLSMEEDEVEDEMGIMQDEESINNGGEEEGDSNLITTSNSDEDILVINGTTVPVQYADQQNDETSDRLRRRQERRVLQSDNDVGGMNATITTMLEGENAASELSSTDQQKQQQKEQPAQEERQCSEPDGCVRNGCNSIACPAGYESTSTTGKDGVFPCRKCHHDFINPYLGANRCFVVDQSKILMTFFNDTCGQNWYGEHFNWGNNNISVCEWSGIACNANDDIISIVLPNTNLHGTISPNLGFLRHLEVLDLSDNFLTGDIPAELNYAPLDVLDISGNALEGVVPPVLCEKQGVNNNGHDGIFSCQKIACPVGTYSTTGRGGGKDGSCVPCDKSAQFLAMKACAPAFMPTNTGSDNGGDNQNTARAIGSVVFLSVMGNLVMLCAFYIFKRRRKMLHDLHNNTGFDDDFVDVEDDDALEHDRVQDEHVMVAISRGGEEGGRSSNGSGGTAGRINHDDIDVADLESDLHLMASSDSSPLKKQPKISSWKNKEKQQRQKNTPSEVWLDVPKIN